jgi:hypothetical protein
VTYENTHIHKYINTHSQTFLFYKKININMPLKLKQLFWADHLIITLLFVIHIVFFFSLASQLLYIYLQHLMHGDTDSTN